MLAALRRGAAPAVAGDDDDLWPLVRLLTFMAGVTPRAVAFSVASGGGTRLAAEGLAFATAAVTTPAALSPAASVLYDALLEQFVAANGELRALVRSAADGSANVHALVDCKCDWERAITPLEWPVVEAAWAATAATHGLPHGRDGTYLTRLVSDLTYAHRFHLQHDVTAARLRLWPMTAAQVAAAGVAPSNFWLKDVNTEVQRLIARAVALGAIVENAGKAAAFA